MAAAGEEQNHYSYRNLKLTAKLATLSGNDGFGPKKSENY